MKNALEGKLQVKEVDPCDTIVFLHIHLAVSDDAFGGDYEVMVMWELDNDVSQPLKHLYALVI